MIKSILNDICYLLLYTSFGRVILGFLSDVAWMIGYTKGRIRRFFIRIGDFFRGRKLIENLQALVGTRPPRPAQVAPLSRTQPHLGKCDLGIL